MNFDLAKEAKVSIERSRSEDGPDCKLTNRKSGPHCPELREAPPRMPSPTEDALYVENDIAILLLAGLLGEIVAVGKDHATIVAGPGAEAVFAIGSVYRSPATFVTRFTAIVLLVFIVSIVVSESSGFLFVFLPVTALAGSGNR